MEDIEDRNSYQLFLIQTGPLQIFAESNQIIKEKCVLAFPEFFLKDWNAVGGLHKKGIFCHCEMASNRVVAGVAQVNSLYISPAVIVSTLY